MCLVGAISFGLLGCVSKLAERKRCDASALVVWLFGWAALIMLIRSRMLTGKAPLPWPVVGLGALLGNVTVGGLVMNLSAGVPALVSMWLYSEKLTVVKSLAFFLALVSLLCLFQGNRLEAREVKP